MQFLLLGLMLFLVYTLLKKQLKNYQIGRKNKEEKIAQSMVRCAYCDVFLPENEALTAGKHYFCCREHWELGSKHKKT
ncbi:hypothetical conserved protein [Candidatus Nitrosoglobus terrae]|uniref:Hypothetical conserved protein n=1 Tax=Candidatus Nitrosoglobus terrae TaxID=1630141 RepID=A0A1Q2SLD7_9GAMM|nr:PP0621 family protein [Candidatus Nitrosoglobus terrae]BAW79948.1 hypothetical conserved protein [Candidatus Nitrosoglobus terrae]